MVNVQVKNPQHAREKVWMFEQPEFFHYQGDEVKLKHVGPDQLALTTGNPEWPVRVIQRNLIVKIDGVVVATAPSNIVVKIVKGSRGDEYTVTGTNGQWTCTCTGFQFRKSCKHLSA
jgi:hypothetical protein